jgi:hypothetical protein
MTKRTKNNVHKLEHYCIIKDPSWPTVHSVEELDQLPDKILKEVAMDYNQITNNTVDVPEKLNQLTHTFINKINSAYEIIKWHLDYYQKYPVKFSSVDQVIDIENSTDEFSSLMKQELNLYHSEIFDQVWDEINA